ncbi:MAG: serine/threonine protein kinase [Muribaculaceae bacterium]|nr:serine/threonine protein kinase [Muribaculaceae bacterium]
MQLKQDTELQNGKYRIVRVLGQGGFGITYLAEHTMLDKYVAIKEFFPKEYCDREDTTSHVTLGSKNTAELVGALKTKFIKEAKNISKLRHPNIITIHDIFEENSTAYYVMEFIDGQSLSDTIKTKGAIDETSAVSYIVKISDAVGYMHSLSMNHLDLKPANIMIRSIDGEPVLIDFGLSKQYDASGGQTSTTPIGISYGYAPIEQYRPGGVATFSPQTDIYALGATLFALLTGNNPPHYSDILEDGLPALPATVSKRAADAIEHAMEIKKNKRPESISMFLSELIADEKIVEKPEPQPAEEAKKPTEETVLIVAEPVVEKPKVEVSAPRNIIIDGIEFVDLGLSVRWANMNIGAKKPSDLGTFIDKTHNSETNAVLEYNQKGAKIPTIGQWEELKNHCSWEWTEVNDMGGYKVKGRNGNYIFMPFTGESANTGFRSFGRLFTYETFYSSNHNHFELYYFYFAHGGIYKLTRYSLNYRCPVRLVYEK